MWLLVVVSSWAYFIPSTKQVTEFNSEQSCLAALSVKKKDYSTVNRESYCISVKEINKKELIKNKIKELEKQFNE